MSKYHFARFRAGGTLVACGRASVLIHQDGLFDCKNCLRVISSKTWSYMINSGFAKTKYKEDLKRDKND